LHITLRAAVAASILLFGANAGSAATATFDLSLNPGQSTNPASLPFSFVLSNADLSVTVSGKTLSGGTASGTTITGGTVGDAKIGRYSGGAGIVTSSSDDHQVDGSGSGADEFVQFAFSAPIILTSARFSFVESDDDFRWLWDANGNGSLGIGDFISSETDIPGSSIFANFGGVESALFGIGAFGGNDEWKLKSVTFDYTVAAPPQDLSPRLGYRRSQEAAPPRVTHTGHQEIAI
jgi:hypothetical protein